MFHMGEVLNSFITFSHSATFIPDLADFVSGILLDHIESNLCTEHLVKVQGNHMTLAQTANHHSSACIAQHSLHSTQPPN